MTVWDQTAAAGRRAETGLQPQGGTASLPNPEQAYRLTNARQIRKQQNKPVSSTGLL